MHTIDVDTLESIILADIQYYAQTAISDEKKLYDRLLSFSGQSGKMKKPRRKKSCATRQTVFRLFRMPASGCSRKKSRECAGQLV
jgi:hypothetical protein